MRGGGRLMRLRVLLLVALLVPAAQAQDRGPLDRPTAPARPEPVALQPGTFAPPKPILIPAPPPPGFSGRSSVAPREVQADAHFVADEDRWRAGRPEWDRYNKGHPRQDDYPYDVGHWWDPYHQNVLKGDFPLLGQNTFLELEATSFNLLEPRLLPTATT